ncbi:DoxX family protein [Bacillus sp. J33]|uniref:DoxX family protein n=1 Tax=Bacillus sp. J33 TaxID=935836 RepID=UPI00047CC8FD|nr:DoxX family protein [Bacillus sp. J33]
MQHSLLVMNLLRFSVSYVFIVSGFMKLISAEIGSAFVNLGLPYPELIMHVVAFLEIVCGVLILFNKSVKSAVIPLIGIMAAAILLTKIPVLKSGFMPFAFDARLDGVMLVLLFILYKCSP